MSNLSSSKAKQCCSTEYARVVREIGTCEMNTHSPEERHNCYRRTARESGRRAKACMASA